MFKETEPINDQFDFFGVGDKNFLNNSGSYGLILCGLFWSTLGYFFLNEIMGYLYKYKVARLLGIWAYRREYSGLLEGAVYKLILETYFDLVICSFINVKAFSDAKDWDDFKEFWNNFDDFVCSAITVFHYVFVFYLPVFCHKLMNDTWKEAKYNCRDFDKERSAWIRVMEANIRQDEYYSRMNTVMFLYRRLMSGMLLIVSRNYPYFQGVVLLMFSTISSPDKLGFLFCITYASC